MYYKKRTGFVLSHFQRIIAACNYRLEAVSRHIYISIAKSWYICIIKLMLSLLLSLCNDYSLSL